LIAFSVAPPWSLQQAPQHDPHAGDLYVFKLIKIFWYDGLGASLYAKRLEKGRFLWPAAHDGLVVITPGQLGYLLEGWTGAIPSTRGGRR
jgi:transposase